MQCHGWALPAVRCQAGPAELLSPVGSQSTVSALPDWPLDARPSPVSPAPAWRAPGCADGCPPQQVPGTPRCCLCSGPAPAALQARSQSQSRPVPGPSSSLSVLQQPGKRVGAADQPLPKQGHSTAAPATARATPPSHQICRPAHHMLEDATSSSSDVGILASPSKSTSNAPATPVDCQDIAAGTPFPPEVSICKGCCRCWAGDWLKPCSSRGGTAGSWWCSSFTPKGPPAI